MTGYAHTPIVAEVLVPPRGGLLMIRARSGESAAWRMTRAKGRSARRAQNTQCGQRAVSTGNDCTSNQLSFKGEVNCVRAHRGRGHPESKWPRCAQGQLQRPQIFQFLASSISSR